MNARQSLKIVRKNLAETEIVLARAQADIKDYNACIDSMIAGGSPCDWCEDQLECQLTAKAEGKGCSEWWLRDRKEEAIESEGVLPAGGEGRGQIIGASGEVEAL